MLKNFLLCLFTGICFLLHAQDGYKLPPKEIMDLVLVKPTPNITIDEKAEWMVFTQSNSNPTVEELAQPELRIAGLRINPANFAPSRQNFINDIWLKNIPEGKEYKITGLPSPLMAGSVQWSPDEKKVAFIHTTNSRVDIYIIDIATRKASKINKGALNTIGGGAYQWLDESTIIYRTALKPASAAPQKPMTPKGPTLQENYGKASPRPTFQDMIKTPYDEQLFEFYSTSQLVKNVNGTEIKIGQPAIYSFVRISPDKKYLLTRINKKPFSYLVPSAQFPAEVFITDMNGKMVKHIASLPSGETAPGGNDNVQNVPRGFDWRDDEAATITWCTPLDSGLIKTKTDYHDAVYILSAPFTSQPKELVKTQMRFRGISWGNATFALVNEGLTGKQTTRTSRLNPSTGEVEKLMERNTTDNYSNPGNPVTEKNQFNRNVIKLIDNGTKLLMNNTTGASANGDLPFLASFDLATKKTEILWRCAEGYFESIAFVLNPDNLQLLTRRENEKEVPNYWIKNLKLKIADRQITEFKNPYPQLEGVTKEKIKYKRADGVDLTGDLYLPKVMILKKMANCR